MPYSLEYMAANGISDPATLKMIAVAGGVANETFPTSADPVQNVVTAQPTHLGRFGVLGYTLSSLSGDYAFNFSMIDARFGSSAQISVDVPRTPYSGALSVPFPAASFRAEQGTVTFDGAGNYSWTAVRNVGGSPTDVFGSGTYTIDTEGNLALDFGIKGTVLAGGSAFVLAATESAPVIEMGMGVKKGGSFDNASLKGSYTVALYNFDVGAGPPDTINLNVARTPYTGTFNVPFPDYALNSELRTMNFDGAGRYTWSGTRNTGGVSSLVSGSGTYAVARDGSLTFDTGLEGHLLAGASTFILTTLGGTIQMGAGVRKGVALSTAGLAGRYTVAYHYSDASAGPPEIITIRIPRIPHSSAVDVPFPLYAFSSEVRTITFDGRGGYSFTGKQDRGGVARLTSGNGSYSVDPDGVLTMDGMVVGNVLEGASTLVLAPTGGRVVQLGVGLVR